MKWTRDSLNSMVSACKRYRIAKYDTQAGIVYALWECGKVPALWYGSREECEQEAIEHESSNRL